MKFAEIISKYLGQPFEKLSCMGLVDRIYADLGAHIDWEYEGLNLDNYMTNFQKDPAGTVEKMEQFFSELGEQADPRRLKVKDLLVVEHPGGVRFPAIYIGNQAAIASFLNGGVTVFGLNSQNVVVSARRIAPVKATTGSLISLRETHSRRET